MNMEKLHGGPNKLLTASKHNKREEPGGESNIDPEKRHLNQVLRGPNTATEVAALAKSLMAAAGIAKAKTSAVKAVEFLFSLPPGTGIDPVAYSECCTAWVARRFGGEQNILSSDLHLDESAPHCHVLLLPLVNGKMNGSDMVGSGKHFQAHVDSFHAEVASKFGLPRPPAALRGNEKAAGVRAVLDWMAANDDPAMRSRAWAATLDAINRHPDKYMAELGINPEVRPLKTLQQTALSRGKGAKTEAEQARRDARLGGGKAAQDKTSHIGELTAANGLPLSCVREVQKPLLPIPSAEQPADRPRQSPAWPVPTTAVTLITRERDSERPSSDWDGETGEMRPAPPVQAQSSTAAQARAAETLLSVRRAA